MNVISEIFDTVFNLLRGEGLQEWGVWSYPLLTVLVILEGRIVTLLAAVAASLGYMRLPPVMISAIVGGIVADGLWYLLGYKYGKEPVCATAAGWGCGAITWSRCSRRCGSTGQGCCLWPKRSRCW